MRGAPSNLVEGLMVTIYVNEAPVEASEIEHRYARPEDFTVFLDHPVRSGDRITYEGDLPVGKTTLWVRFPYVNWKGDTHAHGNLRLTSRDLVVRNTTPARDS